MKSITKIVMLVVIGIATGCAHYSTVGKKPGLENIIKAPIDIVWENTLRILPTERIDVKVANKNTYFIQGNKRITFWSWGDEISIRLFSHGGNQTIVHFEAGAKAQLIGWGHQERMVKDIFNKIKNASETQ